MKVVKEVAKTKDEALNLVLNRLSVEENEIIYNFVEIKGGLFKSNSFECSAFLKKDIIEEVQVFLSELLTNMGLEASLEVRINEDVTTIKIYSSNNSIIIGKDGKNLEALSVITRQFVKKYSNSNLKIILDVEDYKDKQIKRLERLAKNLAREVIKTKADVEMENMNSYERRIVHNTLTNFKGVKTESLGEEPNRHVVIKYIK